MRQIIYTLLFFFTIHISYSQSLIEKTSKETCKCLEKAKPDISQDSLIAMVSKCKSAALLKYKADFEKEYNQKLNKEIVSKIEDQLNKDLVKNCTYVFQLATRNKSEAKIPTTTKTQQCKSFHLGKYKNLNAGNILEFKKDTLIEYNSKGEVMNISSLKWKNDCEYEMQLLSTTKVDPNNEMIKKEKFIGRIVNIDVENKTVTHQVTFKGLNFSWNLKKI